MIKVKTEVLKAIMEENNLSQRQLAFAVGVDPAVISRVLNNKREGVGGKFIGGLLRFTGMKFDDLFYEEERKWNLKQKKS